MNANLISYISAFLVACGLCLSMHSTAIAQPQPVKWTVVTKTLSGSIGDTVSIVLKANIDDGWSTYGLKPMVNKDGIGPEATEVRVDTKDYTVLTKNIKTSKPLIAYDSSFEMTLEKFKHSMSLTIPVRINAVTLGKKSIPLIVRGMACTDQNCLPATEVTLQIPVTVTEQLDKEIRNDTATLSPSQNNLDTSIINTPTPTKNSLTPPPTTEQTTKSLQLPTSNQSQGSLSDKNTPMGTLLLGIILLGMSSWLMPCVYPMIPITVSFFTKRAEKEKTSPITDASIYSIGIMSTFIVFGVLIALLTGNATAATDIATNPWLNLFLAGLFILIAGNLFGMYEISLPSSWVNSLNKKSTESKGYMSSFIMGMVFSLTSFTCTVPFIDIVSKMAVGGEWLRPIYSMTLYAAVFALPFFLLSLFPQIMTKLPRSGAWMNNIKVVFGFIEIALAVSYFARVDSLLQWNFISRETVLAIWGGCTLMILLYVLGVYKMKLDYDKVENVGGIRAGFSVLFAAVTLYLFSSIGGRDVGLFEPFVYVESSSASSLSGTSNTATNPSNHSSQLFNPDMFVPGSWTEDLDAATALSKKTGRSVFIDFTGVSCTNCRKMEKQMFVKPSIQTRMNEMILVHAFTDRRGNPQDEKYRAYQFEKFNSILLPLYVIISSDGHVRGTETYTTDEQAFIQFLDKGKSNQALLE